ncbi:MAG: universal stress protein [Pseudomonadota bacterium]
MSYRTVLVHVDERAHAARRIDVAAAVAARFEGHLIGAALTGISRFLYQRDPLEGDDATLALHLCFLREQAEAALRGFTARLAGLATPTHEARLVDDDAGDGLSLHARGADLVVLGQSEPDAGGRDLPAHVLRHAGRPVLVVPHAGVLERVGRKVLVGWDGGREAARALQLGLPLLRLADELTLAVFDSGDGRVLAEARAADPRRYLARHGVQASLAVHALAPRRGPARRQDIGAALLALGAELSADLLVMGGFGHSRLRASLLGGVTHTVLEETSVPLLMAH